MQDWEGEITSGGGVTPPNIVDQQIQPLKKKSPMAAQFSMLGVVVLIAGLFATVLTLQQQQDNRSRAAVTNVALNKIATADSYCTTSENAPKAVNGSWAGGFSDKWCSRGSTKWLKIDLGGTYSLTSFLIRHAGAGGEPTSYNTKSFNIQVSSDNVSWTTVVSVANNTASQTTHSISPVIARYVRLNIITPEAVYYSGAARIYEFEAYGSASTTIAPTIIPTATPANVPTSIPTSTSINWINTNANTTVSGSTVTKTGGAAGVWDAGATSVQQIQSGRVFAEITINDNITNGRMFGLNHDNNTSSYTDIDYAFYFASSGVLEIYENGTRKASGFNYAVGDVFRIGVENGVTKYYKNSNTMYTSTQTPIYPFFLDLSLRDLNSKISTAKLMTAIVASTPTPTLLLTPTTIPTSTVVPTARPTIVTVSPTAYPTPTPTIAVPTSTPMPSPTPVAVGDTVLQVALGLHGIGTGGDSMNPQAVGNSNPLHPQRPVTVDVYNSQNVLVVSKTGFVTYEQSSGKFIGNVNLGAGFQSGAYTVKVKSEKYLRALVPGIQTITRAQTNNLPVTTLIAGDINGDNSISVLDFNLLMGCYSDLLPPVACSGNYAYLSDLTDDGHTNQFDYNFFLRELSHREGQ